MVRPRTHFDACLGTRFDAHPGTSCQYLIQVQLHIAYPGTRFTDHPGTIIEVPDLREAHSDTSFVTCSSSRHLVFSAEYALLIQAPDLLDTIIDTLYSYAILVYNSYYFYIS